MSARGGEDVDDNGRVYSYAWGGVRSCRARDEGGQTKYELSRARTRTRGARWPHIFSCASFPPCRLPPPFLTSRPPPRHTRRAGSPDDDARHIRRPRLAPRPPIRLDAPRSATTFFFHSPPPVPRDPKISPSSPARFSFPFRFSRFSSPVCVFTAHGARVVWPPRSLRANVYEKTISPAVDVKLSRDVIFSIFFSSLSFCPYILVCFSSFPRLIPFLGRLLFSPPFSVC